MIEHEKSNPAGITLHVTNIPTPYRLPLYRSIRRQLRQSGRDFHVFFLNNGKRQRLWKIGEEDLEGIEYSRASSSARMFADVTETIDRLTPSVVVLSWAMDVTALRLLIYCRRHAIRCLIVTGETIDTFSRNKKRALRGLLRRPFFALADGYIAYGTRAVEYLLSCGVPRERTSIAINVVDTEFFRTEIDRLRESGRDRQEREKYRRPDGGAFDVHLLFVGELFTRKGVSQTLAALAMLADPAIALHIVGSGPQEEEIRAEVVRLGLESRMFIHGYRQKSELPLYYSFADILLFPSLEEVFGLVLVEGAAAALPIIASVWAGGTPDVVFDEKNGLVIDPHDIAAYAAAIRRLVESPEERRRMGEEGRRHAITALTPERSAQGYITALKRVWKN